MELSRKDLMKLIFSFLFLLIALFSNAILAAYNSSYFDIPLFHGKNAQIKINFCAPSEYSKDIYILADDIPVENYVMKTKNAYFNAAIDNKPIRQLKISNSEALPYLDNVIIYLESRIFYYPKNEILNFEKDSSGNYVFPSDLKYFENSKYINDKGIIKSFFTNFMAVFYDSTYFFFVILCLIMAALLFPFKNNKNKIAIFEIILLGFILRISDLSLDFWTDEIYTTFIASAKNAPFIATFEDPGNPPFYFILAKIWIFLFGSNEAVVRFLSVIISTFSIWAVYKFLKQQFKGTNSWIPLLGAFLFSISLYSIVTAQEARCYALCILLNIGLSYYLFKIIKENKGLVPYTLLAICAINTHYFEALFLLSNFIFGLIFIEKPLKLKFAALNIISGISFLPYFFMTALNKGLLNENFNVFKMPDLFFYLELTDKFLLGCFGYTVILAFAIYLLRRRDFYNTPHFKTFFYSLYLILSLYLFSYSFSYIKPIAAEYYFIILLPFYLFLPLIICFFPYNNKKAKFFFIFLIVIILLFFPKNYLQRDKTSLINFKRAASYFATDSKRTKENSALILPHPYKMYKNAYPNLIPSENKTLHLNYKSNYNDLENLMLSTDYKAYYLWLEYNIWRQLPSDFDQKYALSLIRTGNDILLAKIVKK